MKKIVIIPSAGKNSRMNNKIVPKGLRIFNNKTILDLLIENLDKYVDIIYISISKKDFKNKIFKKKILPYNQKKVKLVPTIGGSGDGQAILDALHYVIKENNEIDHVMICWSDVFIYDDNILDFSYRNLKIYNDSVFFLPTKFKKNPYVGFLRNKHGLIEKVLYTKKGDKFQNMEQDHCIFFIKPKILFDELKKYQKFYKPKEFIFLNIINWLFLKKYSITAIKYNNKKNIDPVLSFNTDQELNIINKTVNENF